MLATVALVGDDGVERPAPGMAPTAFRIWRAGVNPTDMGDHVFSEQSAEMLMAEQSRRGNLYSIDVDHMSLNAVSPPESRKAVGWHRLAVRPGEGGPELWAVDLEWTDAVRKGLESTPPEWRYFSPAYELAKDSTEIVSYLNTALTNNPATHAVTALASLQAASRTTMDYKEMAMAFFGDDPEKKDAAKKCYAEMSDAEKKAFKAAWKAAQDFEGAAASESGEGGGGEPDGDEKKKQEEAARAARATAEAEEAKRQAAARAAQTERELALAARVDALEKERVEREARDKADADARERETIFAKRPDIGQEVRASLAKLPLADLKTFVEKMPRVQASAGASANTLRAAAGVSGGEGGGVHGRVPMLDESERRIFASLRPRAAGAFRATRKGSALIMPDRNGTHEERKARIAELDKELEAIHAERA